MGLVGLWDVSLVTLTLMTVSIFISVSLGIPVGILASRSDRFDVVLRPVLDAMQTMPTFVYLIPVMLLFGIGPTSAVIATVIYAVPPVIRLTNLGIRQVSLEALEAASLLRLDTDADPSQGPSYPSLDLPSWRASTRP